MTTTITTTTSNNNLGHLGGNIWDLFFFFFFDGFIFLHGCERALRFCFAGFGASRASALGSLVYSWFLLSILFCLVLRWVFLGVLDITATYAVCVWIWLAGQLVRFNLMKTLMTEFLTRCIALWWRVWCVVGWCDVGDVIFRVVCGVEWWSRVAGRMPWQRGPRGNELDPQINYPQIAIPQPRDCFWLA